MDEAAKTVALIPELQEAAESGKFMVGITFIDKDGNLQHRLITRDFPPTDMRRSHEEIKKLIMGDIKRMLAEDVEKAKSK